MKKVSLTHHLIRRNGVWHYRRRVPTSLVKTLGKNIIQFSLGTPHLKEAKKRRAAEDLKWSTQFEMTEQKVGLPGTSQQAQDSPVIGLVLSEREVIRLVHDYVERTDARSRDRLLHEPPESEQQKAEIRSDIEIGQQILRNRDDPRADEIIQAAGQKVLQGVGLSIDDERVPYAAFAEFVRRGLLELDQRKLARLDDDHGKAFFDQQFNPGRPADVTFGELADQFLQLVEEEAAANRTSQKWVDKQHTNVALVREIVGNATPILAVDYDSCLRVRSALGRFPTNRTKLYPKLSIDQAIARAQADGKPLLSPVTQDRYLGTLRDILDLAAKKRLIGFNPAAGMKPLKRDATSPSEKRPPFTLEQLKSFFESDFYQECAKHSPPYKHDKTRWRFWLPLMCLFMGMRPKEACQMDLDDVKCTPQGTWHVDIVASTDEEEENGSKPAKTLKTAFSRRRIPIHPELIAIGFLDYVQDQRLAGRTRLFHALKPDGYGNLASYALKRFRDTFLPNAITMLPGQTFYSLRHSFRDELRRIGAPPDALQALGAWSQGKLTSDDYGDKSNPDYQAQYVKQIAFPGLDLLHLHASPE